jgi:hypothetical protein
LVSALAATALEDNLPLPPPPRSQGQRIPTPTLGSGKAHQGNRHEAAAEDGVLGVRWINRGHPEIIYLGS